MSNFVPLDAAAIDTNVFEHLLNPQYNSDEHITSLLVRLRERNAALLLDNASRIWGEYTIRIIPAIKNAHDKRTEIPILRYWMQHAPKLKVEVNGSSELMMIIKKIIVEPQENVDRILVYVALYQGEVLISNDQLHIIAGPSRENKLSPRRRRLLRDTRKKRQEGANILTSSEALQKIQEI